jgi:hypothetical protein
MAISLTKYSVKGSSLTAAEVDANWTEIADAIDNGELLYDWFMVAVGDETTALETGTGKLTFRMPHDFYCTDIRANVVTAPTGSAITVDVNDDGVTMLSTKLTIDASEKTSTTAATPLVISVPAVADDSEMTIDIDAVGSTVKGAGLKITFYGYKLTI